MSSEVLANELIAIHESVATTKREREFLIEAAKRLQKLHKLEVWMEEQEHAR